jgi:hypothetical protein
MLLLLPKLTYYIPASVKAWLNLEVEMLMTVEKSQCKGLLCNEQANISNGWEPLCIRRLADKSARRQNLTPFGKAKIRYARHQSDWCDKTCKSKVCVLACYFF